MTDKVTIVIPVYNAEKYLATGIRSLLNQTHKNIEIILVDDCSTDSSWDIAQNFTDEHPDIIQTIRKEHNSGGPLRGREIGIEKATGDWITFMDCDDFVEPKYVEHLLETTNNGKFDIAVTGHARYYSNDHREKFFWNNYSQTTDERLATFYEHFISENFWTDPSDTAGQNLVRASVAKQAAKRILSKQPDNLWAEDTFMALAFLACSNNGINFHDFHDFNWRQREGSGSHGGFSDTADKNAFYDGMKKIFSKKMKIFSKNLPLISIIIPIYNVEKYVAECLASVVNQTYENIEIICVDDKTLDGSGEIADGFAEKDLRIKIIHKKKNEGSNMARKTGFEHSHGKYITFVDSDDAIREDYIEKLFGLIVRYGTDISIAGHEVFMDGDNAKKMTENVSRKIFHSEIISKQCDIINGFLLRFSNFPEVFPMTAWSKMFDREIIAKTDWTFSNYSMNEDNFELIQWFSFAHNGVSVTDDKVYLYRKNQKSKTSSRYENINPSGQRLNAMEFDDEMYEKTRQYIGDGFNESLLKYYFDAILSHIIALSLCGNFTKEDGEATVKDLQKIWLLGDRCKANENSRKIAELTNDISTIKSSRSWRYTAFLRKLGKNARIIRKKL